MRNRAKKGVALLLTAGLAAGMIGCARQAEETSPTRTQPEAAPQESAVTQPERELVTLSLCEVTHSVFYAPQYAAMALGFFEEEGIALELTNGGGADKVMTAVLSGGAEIGLAGPEAAIYVWNEGRADPCVVFAQLTKRDGAFLVGRTPDDDFSWEKLAGSYLIGGRAGGVPLMTLEYLLRSKGLTPNEDLTVDSSIQFNMMAGAFTGGTGDYVALFEPTASQVALQGQGYILASIGAEAGEVPYTAYFAAESFLEDHPDLALRFARAVARGQEWVKEHSAAEIAAVIEPFFPDSDLDLLTAATQRHKEIDAWNDTPVMKQSAFDRLQDIMEQAGELEQRVPFEEVVDNSFAEAAAGAVKA